MAILLYKPLMIDSKYRWQRTFEVLSVDLISSCVEQALQENRIQFIVIKNFRREKLPHVYYDVCFRSEKDGLEIGISKEMAGPLSTWVYIRYNEMTSELLLNRMKDGIERKATESLMR